MSTKAENTNEPRGILSALKRLVSWILQLIGVTRYQCATMHFSSSGGYVYCTKRRHHFGSHASYCGDMLTATPVCYDCKKPIEENDSAMVCIQCGGINRRISS